MYDLNLTFHSKENPADKARTKLKLNKMPLTLGEAPISPDQIAAPEYI